MYPQRIHFVFSPFSAGGKFFTCGAAGEEHRWLLPRLRFILETRNGTHIGASARPARCDGRES
ncbi:hypothetical protein B0D78_11620 [Pyramidobacter sp. C12-8]|nr:hypothetical protein B0D78_11620 [Pyramidobacter sp. C12-8]